MPRLRAELERLFACPDVRPYGDQAGGPEGGPSIGAKPMTRAMVLEFVQPVNVLALGDIWQGVQSLGFGGQPGQQAIWPAPAIAVNGRDAMQLWFSLEQPLEMQAADTLLQALCRHFLPDLPARSLRQWVNLSALARSADGADSTPSESLEPEAALDSIVSLAGEERWSAFVAADLAPLLAETPWLDFPPNRDGQAKLLANLKSISSAALAEARQALEVGGPSGSSSKGGQSAAAAANLAENPVANSGANSVASPSTNSATGSTTNSVTLTSHASANSNLNLSSQAEICSPASLNQTFDSAQQFLLAVMNEPSVPLAQRIEAAKTLLLSQSAPKTSA